MQAVNNGRSRPVDVRRCVPSVAGMLSVRTRPGWWALLLAAALLGGGCDAWNRAGGDEERELHYVQGLNLKIQGQTEKAIESFTQALQVNPNNAAAHLALGDLHYDKTRRFIVAAYHYSEYSRLKASREPGFKPTEINERIKACELSVAANYADSIGRRAADTELEGLKLDLARLTEENRILRRQAGIEGLRVTPTNPPPAQAAAPARNTAQQPVTATPSRSGASPTEETRRAADPMAQTPAATAAATPRVHKVVSGDTPSAIARRYGVTLKALQAANPGMRANQLRIGQAVNIPAK